MKHLIWIWTLALFCLCRPAPAAPQVGSVPPDLAGFTPTMSLSIVLREPNFWAGQDKTMSATVTLDGPAGGNTSYNVTVTGPPETNTNISFTLSVSGNSSQTITVTLPTEAKPATYTATATAEGKDGLSDSDTTRGYSLGLAFKHGQVAIGAKENEAHQSPFTLTATDIDGPVAGIEVSQPEVTEGGLGPHDGVTASVEMDGGSTTDGDGKVTGKFTSGNRLQSTQIGIKRDEIVVLSASIEQVWNALGDEAWSYEPYFYYDESSDIEYRMAYNRDGGEVKITGHSMEPETTSISGYEWDYNAGEDWDEDGSPDGDYKDSTYSIDDADSTGYDAWSGLVEWGGVSEIGGTYTASQTIKYDEDFELDSVYFWLWDNDSFGKDGDE